MLPVGKRTDGDWGRGALVGALWLLSVERRGLIYVAVFGKKRTGRCQEVVHWLVEKPLKA